MEPDGKPRAWIVDIDGTLAIKGDRGPFDWNRVGEDAPNTPVVAVVRALLNDGHRVLYVSGRMEQCREATIVWLQHYVPRLHAGLSRELHMRPDDDYRPDEIFKREVYEREIKPRYEIAAVVDDRRKVVAMWRSLGLTVLDVADGNF
jgi:hypothetical protein